MKILLIEDAAAGALRGGNGRYARGSAHEGGCL